MGVVSAGLVRIKQISRGCPEALCTEIMESHVGCSVQRWIQGVGSKAA